LTILLLDIPFSQLESDFGEVGENELNGAKRGFEDWHDVCEFTAYRNVH